MPKAHPIKTLPTREYLLACFDYDLSTGALTWKRRPREHFATYKAWATWNARFAGEKAGHRNKQGYIRLRLGSFYQAHRLIWKLMTGKEPPNDLDHKNGDPGDNQWANLRSATRGQQQWNSRLRNDSLSGFKGVRRLPSGRFQAHLKIDGKSCSLGTFKTPQEASLAREAMAHQQRGEFYR